MIGTHPNVGFKFGRWLDTVMMQRALGEGAHHAAGGLEGLESQGGQSDLSAAARRAKAESVAHPSR